MYDACDTFLGDTNVGNNVTKRVLDDNFKISEKSFDIIPLRSKAY